VNGDTADIVAALFDFTRMDSNPELQAEVARCGQQSVGALNSASRTVERGKKSVTS
jgi:hypothetical protein